jgi:hypothetical protein
MEADRRELQERWARTTRHLQSALSCVTQVSPHGACGERIRWVREWLDHNELGLALGELEALGESLHLEEAFWEQLTLAATEMGLHSHVQRLRDKWAS